MDKDIVYVEPDYDITDIIDAIKTAKHKIVALVPPKKAGVLHSSVNFRLIAKTATKNNKTVVLITADEALKKFALGVNMPVAKTLQSKPEIPSTVAEEFDEDSDVINAKEHKKTGAKDIVIRRSDTIKDDEKDDDKDARSAKKTPRPAVRTASEASASATAKTGAKTATAKTAKTDSPDVVDIGTLDPDDSDTAKGKAKKKIKVPDFKRVRLPIILGGFAIIGIGLLLFWAFVVAPSAHLTVTLRASERRFSEIVKIVTDKGKEDIAKGIFYAEEKELEHTASADFVATGEVDKGRAATGTLTLRRNSPINISNIASSKQIVIPVGTRFTYNNALEYETTEEAVLEAPKEGEHFDLERDCTWSAETIRLCTLTRDIMTEVTIQAVKKGDDYNVDAALGGGDSMPWQAPSSAYLVDKGGEISGGTSKKVTVVSDKDLEAAEADLNFSAEKDAKTEIDQQFSAEYLVVGDSFESLESKITSSPAKDEEVKDDITPKIVKTAKYKVLAVKRDDIDQFIRQKISENERIGDNTQDIYSTGIEKALETPVAFFEAFKKNDGTIRLKSVAKIGPHVTEQMLADRSLGKKVGEVRTQLASINGIADVQIDLSFPWVTSIPKDLNKVSFEIKFE